jgi:hypothetical protein
MIQERIQQLTAMLKYNQLFFLFGNISITRSQKDYKHKRNQKEKIRREKLAVKTSVSNTSFP